MNETVSAKGAIFTRIAELVSTLTELPLEKITPESTFQKLGLDSLDALALINDLEEEYGVRIPNQEVLKIRTVGQAADTLQKQLPG